MILIDSFFTFFLVIQETYIKKDKVCREVFKYLEKVTGGSNKQRTSNIYSENE
jgi:hypothetical protein